MSRIAGKDFTTLADIERMAEACRVATKGPASGSDRPAAAANRRGCRLHSLLDGRRQIGTECGAREEAEKRLADYIASKYAPERRERPLSEIRIADVIGIYLADVVPGQANPAKAGERAERLLEFWGLQHSTM